jgi:hypothetical protein
LVPFTVSAYATTHCRVNFRTKLSAIASAAENRLLVDGGNRLQNPLPPTPLRRFAFVQISRAEGDRDARVSLRIRGYAVRD